MHRRRPIAPSSRSFPRVLGLACLLALPVVLVTLAVRRLLGGALTGSSALVLWGIAIGLLMWVHYGSPYRCGPRLYVLPWPGIAVLLCGVAATGWYGVSGKTAPAWGVLSALWCGLLFAAELLRRQSRLRDAIALLAALALGGSIPVLVTQIEARSSEEEFFAALQMLVLGAYVAGLVVGGRVLSYQFQRPTLRGIRLRRQPLLIFLVMALFLGGCVTVRAYQDSFYSSEAPNYPGIDPETPFRCAAVAGDGTSYDGAEVFIRLLGRVEANPRKGTPEYGMLALATGSALWAEDFRTSILQEAHEGRFTEPAQSVKYSQYEASQRAYYYPRIVRAFPKLFSGEEDAILRGWFAAINKRALTVEWVDGLYAVAFTKWPEGPYENQESGAGLLALLESEGLADPALSTANRDYLLRNQRGWNQRFRNSDDAFVYQLEWINNAYFQSFYTTLPANLHRTQAFEWLMLQALPDGSPLSYNHVARPSLAGVAYLGATLLGDPRYIWLAGRALDALESRDEYLGAQPGVESPVMLLGQSPSSGSCLIYGDSGLPNQVGPLAPDKVVLRDGWSADSAYMLLNLRFTGWHRYKATQTLTLAYQGQPLIRDEAAGQPFAWLPEGRSLFRDKRIPRENLNGLLIPRRGLGAVLHNLTGMGSPWAQDPPYYASVVDFSTDEEMANVHTRLSDWHGWQHDRQITLYSDAQLIVIVDYASGDRHETSQVVWHLGEAVNVGADRVRLSSQASPVEVVWVPWGVQGDLDRVQGPDGAWVVSCAGIPGELGWVTILLRGQWVGAEVALDSQSGVLRIGTQSILLAAGPD